MKGLNLASFKKMKEDAQSATMIHKDGHQIVIAKGALSHLQRKQLEALPVHNYAAGGLAVPGVPADNTEAVQIPQSVMAPPESTTPDPTNATDPYDTEDTTPELAAQTQQGQAEAAAPASDQTASSSSAAEAPPAPAQTPLASAQSPATTGQSDAYQAEKDALREGANAIANQGEAEAKAISDHQTVMANLPSQQDVITKNKAASDALFQSFKDAKVDPNAYWTGPNGHSKIAAGIGILVSGLGQALGGTNGNVALDQLNKNIDRQIDMQKNAQGQALNAWHMNRQALGDDLAANLATKNQMYTALKYSIDKAGAEAKGPIAKAAANAAIARVDQQLYRVNALQGLHAALNNQAGPGTEEAQQQALQAASGPLGDPEMAKDAAARTIPGYGVARAVPPTPEDRSTLATLDELDNNLDKASALAASAGTTMYGTVANKKADDLATNIKLGLGSIYGFKKTSPELQEKYNDLVGSPGALNTARAQEGYKSLKEFVAGERNGTLNKLGVIPFKKDPAAVGWAAAHPGDPRAAAIINANRHKR